MYELIIPQNVGVNTQPKSQNNWELPDRDPNQKVYYLYRSREKQELLPQPNHMYQHINWIKSQF